MTLLPARFVMLSAVVTAFGFSSAMAETPAQKVEDKPAVAGDKVPAMGMKKEKRDMKHMQGRGTEYMIKKMDTDGNGKVSKAEHDAFQVARFKETDANNDGSVTADEIEAYQLKKRQERQEMMQKMGGGVGAPHSHMTGDKIAPSASANAKPVDPAKK